MMIRPKKNTTVVVAMSGGVDSSVAAALLLEEGYTVIGVTMKTYDFDRVGGNPGNESGCCGLDAFNDARIVAGSLGIPHYVVDFTGAFGREVIDNFVSEYLHGRTPNPCVICNRSIKWGELMSKATALGAEYLATGHYARVGFDEAKRRFFVARAIDRGKDQSYALWGLSQKGLARTLFPLGKLRKPEVRETAARFGLKTAGKKESFEICFVPDNDYRRFLQARVPGLNSRVGRGDILRGEKVVGAHAGFYNYTIGQRSGIGAFGERAYVTAIDPSSNSVTIGRGDALLNRGLVASHLNLVGIASMPSGLRVDACIRYKDAASPATVFDEGGGTIRVIFDEPKRAITPGQSVVMYDGETLIGGGIIEQACDVETETSR